MHNLGVMHASPDPVSGQPNLAKAFEWFSRAAEQGMSGSCATLGMMYENGNGVEKDAAKAREWYRRAGFSDEEMTLGEALS